MTVQLTLRKLAVAQRKVHVREHVRRLRDGSTTVVDEHVRTDDAPDELPPEVAKEPDEPPLVDIFAEDPAPAEGLTEEQLALLQDPEASPEAVAVLAPEVAADAVEQETERKELEQVAQGRFSRLTKEQELAAWRKWKSGGKRPEDLEPLLHSLQPLIRHRMQPYLGRVKMIPDAAIEAEFNIRAVEALGTYDPEKAGLATHVYRYLNKSKRFIAEHQNIGRIPEARVYQIRRFQQAKESLQEEFGRAPTVKELAERLKWSVAETDRMDSEMRSDLMTQGFESDPYAFVPSKTQEVLQLFSHEKLTDNERKVFEWSTGVGGTRVKSTAEMAKLLKLKDYDISRIKKRLAARLQRYVEE